jgi:hypothetical protein
MAESHRFSSRRQRLDHSFLVTRLTGAKSYKRIAGYFRSSIFELVGEEIADIPHVQIVCNMDWKHLLAYITGTVDQALLLRNEYWVTENRLLRNQITGRVRLTDAERKTLAEIGH